LNGEKAARSRLWETTMEIAFKEIEKEFNETFGYVRQDIAAILRKNLGLNYTIALLVCCACEMLAWHRDLKEDEVFTSLLPDTEAYRTIGKTLWEALRNGLAHKFRPYTISIEDHEWRFSISSGPGPHMSVTKGQPNWIRLNMMAFSERVTSQIDAYEQELRSGANARLNFEQKSKSYVKKINADATRIADALRSVLGKTHP
jgi:hypothetical protein